MSYTARNNQLIITVENPRFAGMNYDPMDPTPYGEAIDKMFHSMVETYRKTGSLLLQPVVVEEANEKGEHPVRAGYTRALTFITRYDDLCKELGTNVTLPIIVFTEIDAVDSLMENILRTAQHYMSVAHTIDAVLSEKKRTPAQIASQLGIKADTVVKLRRMVSFPQELKKLCYDDIITEDAAIAFTTLDLSTQETVAKHIIESDIREVSTQLDVMKLVRNTYPMVIKQCPVDPFVDVDGTEYGHISEEEWCISLGLGAYHYREGDRDKMLMRTKAYWLTVAKVVGEVKPGDKALDYAYSSNYIQVEAGSYPNEVAVWNRTETYIEFYCRRADIEKVKSHKETIELAKSKAIERGKLAAVTLSDQAKIKLMQDTIFHAAKDTFAEHPLDTDSIVFYLFECMYARMNNVAKSWLSKLYGYEVTEMTISNIEPSRLPVLFAFATLLGEYSVHQAHKRFFKDNSIDWDKLLKDKQKEVEVEKKQLLSEAKDKAESIGDTQADIIAFVSDLMRTVVAGPCVNLYTYLMSGDIEEKYLKYIAKGISQPYKGEVDINRKRLRNVIGQLVKAYDIPMLDEEDEEFLHDLKDRVTPQMPEHAAAMTSSYMSNMVNDMMRYCVQANLASDTIFDTTIAYMDALNYRDSMNIEMAVASLQAQVMHKVLKSKELSVAYITSKGKVCILA